ncbi:MAG: NAD(P)-binding domain-containing protein [bacterium]|nr:NAD(P)-binding domain-containing protein [bacterium]
MLRNHPASELPRVCVIGAGCSGIATAKALKDRDIPFDVYEKGSDIGGLWRIHNDNGMSSIYKSLHINTHRDRMEYRDMAMPEHYPDYPGHKLIHDYFRSYCERFDLYPHIHLNTGVKHVERQTDGTYEVRLDNGGIEYYDAVLVANGHHWSERWPDPEYPGQSKFKGKQIHAHHYVDPKKPLDLHGKRVVVVGMGNSAMDIASEICRPGVAEEVYLSGRRGAYVFPKYLFGKPFDKFTELFPPWVPFRIKELIGTLTFRIAVGKMEDFGLPKPDFRLGQAHPTISHEILGRLGSGDLSFKPGIKEFSAKTVRFNDGSEVEADVVIWCTGYNVKFPFFDEGFIAAHENDLPLFHRAIQPGLHDLFFIGLLQPLGPVMPLSEAQAKWLAEYLTGEYALPSENEMQRQIEKTQAKMHKRYLNSARHTMQVDFEDFLHELKKEVKRGRKRAKQTNYALPIQARAKMHKSVAAKKSGKRTKRKPETQARKKSRAR